MFLSGPPAELDNVGRIARGRALRRGNSSSAQTSSVKASAAGGDEKRIDPPLHAPITRPGKTSGDPQLWFDGAYEEYRKRHWSLHRYRSIEFVIKSDRTIFPHD